jgi:hypothetical protein
MTMSWKEILEQACYDLNEAHNELLRAQKVPESEWYNHDWPEWTSQANTIRIAESLIGKKLAKTDQWTTFPESQQKF